MAVIPAWENHPEMAFGAPIAPMCCPYCGEIESFSEVDKVDNLMDAVIEFARMERG